MRGMMYELVLVIGTIVFAAFLWTVLMRPMGMVRDIYKNMTPANFSNVSVNQTEIRAQLDLSYNAMYFSLFIIIMVLFVFIVKVAVQHQKWGGFGG